MVKNFEEFIGSKIKDDIWAAMALDYYPYWKKSKKGHETEKRKQYLEWLVDSFYDPNMNIVSFHKLYLGICIQLLRNNFDGIFKCSLHLLDSSNSEEIDKNFSEFANHYKTYNMQDRFRSMYEKGLKMNNNEYLTDIAIIVAFKEELLAIKKQSDSWTKLDNDQSVFTFFTTKTKNGLTVIVAESGKGPSNATNLTKDILQLFSPNIIFLTGIAGGIAEGINLGDVVIANLIVNYDNGKIEEGKIRYRWDAYNTDTYLSKRIKDYPDDNWINNISSPHPSGLKKLTILKHLGIMMSGAKVISDKEYAANLKSVWEMALAVEMESGGVGSAINQSVHKPRFAVIKSISDYADPTKNDDWHPYCCDVAAALTMSYINSLDQSTIAFLQGGTIDQTYPSIIHSDLLNTTDLEYQEVAQLRQMDEISLEELKDMLKKFTTVELREFMFDIGEDWENIAGRSKIEKIMEMIEFFKNRDQLPYLIHKIKIKRPNLFYS